MATKKTTIKPRKQLRDVDRAFIHAVMFEAGILPIEKTTLNMGRALKQLPEEEARILKRKFRKLWRKAMKKQIGDPQGRRADAKKTAAEQKYGVGKHKSSRAEKNARKQLVFDEMWEQYIVPLLINFETAGEANKKQST